MIPYEGSLVHAGELAALIRMDQHPDQGFRRQMAIWSACIITSVVWRPCVDQPATRCEWRSGTTARQADPPVVRIQVVSVTQPLSDALDIKLPGQRVVDYEGWPATMVTGPSPIASLCLDARQSWQPCHAVWVVGLALIEQIIMQLMVAINPAAVVPGLTAQPSRHARHWAARPDNGTSPEFQNDRDARR